MSLHARQQLKHLAEIGLVLAGFESIERTMPAILSLMTRTLHVRGATLITNLRGRMLVTGWKTQDTSPDRSRLDEVHARSAYEYLAGVRIPSDEPDTGVKPKRRSTFSSKDLRSGLPVDERNNFVALPLVVEGGRVFGALQVEGDLRLDETDLLFVSSIVQQLAIALDRQALRASRDAVSKAMRMHAAERIAELQQAERIEHFLADLSVALMDSLDYERTLAAVVRSAVPFLADVCFFDDVSESDVSERGLVVRTDAAGAGLPRERGGDGGRVSADGVDRWGQPQDEVLATGRSVVLPVPGHAGTTTDEEYSRTMKAAGFRSMMVVPLIARGETLGALTFALRGPKRRYGSADLDLAKEVARRAAVAIDRARLHRRVECAVQARENILNIVSHDLRSPLNTVMVSAALLGEDLRGAGDSATSTKALEMIQRSVRRMERMVGDLVDAASIDAGRLRIVKDDHVLQGLVGEAIEASRSTALRRSQQLEARLPKEPIRVACDRGRIMQVLSNLIDNAIKFTPRGGSITVGAEKHETEIRFRVSDTGAGIEPGRLPFALDRYFQAKDIIATSSGLGLYISKGIIESHGGALWAESELGQGSTFLFTLPRA